MFRKDFFEKAGFEKKSADNSISMKSYIAAKSFLYLQASAVE